MSVSEILESWYNKNKRDLPWRNTRLPYHIWLSEIILQQTRVNQGLEYYLKFIRHFPQIDDLAKAPIDEVLKLWQGLGYYTRARNLYATAQMVVNEYNGNFPSGGKELLRLKGIGSYTAAAIASIAFKEPVALVDGNVFRVLSRLYDIREPVNTAAGKAVFKKIANEILDHENPDIHNQALMEFGALVCIPRNPHCEKCVLATICKANIQGIVEMLPVKQGKRNIRTRYFNYLFIRYNDKTYLNKRARKDIWNSLYELPLVETMESESFHKIVSRPPWSSLLMNKPVKLHGRPKTYKHQLTHQTLFCTFYFVDMIDEPNILKSDYKQVSLSRLDEYAIPRVIDKFLEDLKLEGIL